MKKVIMTMMAALFISSAAFAQENKEQGKCCEQKCEQFKCCEKKCGDKKDCDKKFDKKDFVKMQTEMTVKRYNLDEKQAAKLLDLNQKYADMRKNYETDLQKIMTPEQFEQYKADRQKHGMRGHHGKRREPFFYLSRRWTVDLMFCWATSGFMASSKGNPGGLMHSTWAKPASSNC